MAIIKRIVEKGTSYQVRVRDANGRKFPAKTFERKVDAERYERELLNLRDSGGLAPHSSLKSITVNKYFETWMRECRGSVSKGWKDTHFQMFQHHVAPVIGERKLLSISKRELGCLLNDLGLKGLSQQTKQHIYNLLRKMFQDGIDHFEILTINPVHAKLRPSVPRKEREFLSVEESWRLLDAVRNEWYGPAIWIGLLSALRPGEIQALKWDDVDLENNRLLIRGNFCRKEKVLKPNPKQKDWGQAPIPEPLKAFLLELRQKSTSQFVAGGFERHEMLNYDSFRKALKNACQRLGITSISPHELRHSATELYYSAGAGTEDLKRLLNHKSAQTTQTYIHRTDERLSKIAGTINNVIPIRLGSPIENGGHIVDTSSVLKRSDA